MRKHSKFSTRRWILRRLLKEPIRESAVSEFEERFEHVRSQKNYAAALLWYWAQILYLIPLYSKDTLQWGLEMFSNNLKISVRNIKRNRVYSLINITGLAIGLASCILIMLWVQDEWSYDRFYPQSDSLYRVVQELSFSSGTKYTETTPSALVPALKQGYTDIAESTRFFNTGWSIQYKNEVFSEDGSFADSDFLGMFSLEFLAGDPSTALNDAQSIVITNELAAKLFGNTEAVGQILNIDNAVDCIVTGVVQKLPHNSHIYFDYIVPFSIFAHRGVNIENWEQSPFLESYVLLQPTSHAPDVDEKIAGIIQSHVSDSDSRIFLQPLKNVHLHNLQGGGAITYVYIFSCVAAFTLLIACINFVNLTTARSRKRAKEVGIRKVVGGCRKDILRQFFGETLVLVLLAVLIAVAVVLLLLPIFNQLAQKQLRAGTILQPQILILLFSIIILTGIVAGTYPALYLSAFRPVQAFKGSQQTGRGGSFRRTLVIAQFSLSALLIICTLGVFQQLKFIQAKPLGFKKELVLATRMAKGSPDFEPVKREMIQKPQILNVTAVDRPPSYRGASVTQVEWKGKPPDEKTDMEFRYVDYDFFKTFGMEIILGRAFSPEFPRDLEKSLIINETAARIIGKSGEVGSTIKVNDTDYSIIGVVRDFHLHSFYTEIRPLLITMNPQECLYVCIRIAPGNVSDTIKHIAAHWERMDPGYEFEYEFLDDRINRTYRSERRLSTLLSIFTGLTLLISCLGLLGLAAHIGEQRTKEIGIRKVLGATTSGILVLLSKDFTKWVLFANMLAWPAAYLLMRNWLQNFAYRAKMEWWIFMLSAILGLGIAVLTTAYQAIKSARADPVNSLRFE
jgi:putative ABC transport system permease protein